MSGSKALRTSPWEVFVWYDGTNESEDEQARVLVDKETVFAPNAEVAQLLAGRLIEEDFFAKPERTVRLRIQVRPLG